MNLGKKSALNTAWGARNFVKSENESESSSVFGIN